MLYGRIESPAESVTCTFGLNQRLWLTSQIARAETCTCSYQKSAGFAQSQGIHLGHCAASKNTCISLSSIIAIISVFSNWIVMSLGSDVIGDCEFSFYDCKNLAGWVRPLNIVPVVLWVEIHLRRCSIYHNLSGDGVRDSAIESKNHCGVFLKYLESHNEWWPRDVHRGIYAIGLCFYRDW